MAFKMPGLLKSPAFAVGALTEINVRYDRMAENAEKYKLAAQKRGAELFKEHKNTKDRLKVENEAKQYVAAQFTPELADYLDSTGSLGFTVGMDTKDFLEQVDAEAQKVMGAGGVPETFTANENMYYGDQRFEEYEQSYGKVKNFMDTQNNVFGDSFGMLMEENTPEKMTKEQFGVTARADIASLERKGLGATEIDSMTEIRLNKQIMEFGGFESMIKQVDAEGNVSYSLDNPNEAQVANIAKRLANTHYRFNPKRAEDGIGGSATFGISLSRNIVGQAQSTDTIETALNDLANIRETIKYTVPGIASSASEMDSTMNSSISLYLYMLGQRTTDPNLVQNIKNEIEKRTGEKFVSTIGAVTV